MLDSLRQDANSSDLRYDGSVLIKGVVMIHGEPYSTSELQEISANSVVSMLRRGFQK